MKLGRINDLHELNWGRYPVRTCRTLHHCEICSQSIVMGERYRDGGYSRRAHEACYQRTEVRPAQTEDR